MIACDCVCRCGRGQTQRIHTSFKYLANKAHKLLFSMTTDKGSQKLRHLKYREKIGGRFPTPSKIDIQVVGSGGRGTPKAVLLSTDHSKYLFNCGEGTQRIATEFKMRLSKLENIFITHKNWDNVGGLLGMGLTLEAMKVPRVIIHGPPGVESVAMMAKGFAESTSMVLEKKELGDGNFEDSAFKIDYVPFYKKGFDPGQLEQQLEKLKESQPEKKRHKQAPIENAIAVAYICWPVPPQRRIILEKCVELGIETGPVLGRLKNGESITLENGNVVHPDQVLSDPEVAHPVIIVECPDEQYLESLLENQQLASHQERDNTDPQKPAIIIHMTSASVYRSQQYQDWMSRFGSATQHLVLNELASDVAFEGVYRYQSQLHLVHPTIFPTLRHLPPVSEACDDDDAVAEGEEGSGKEKNDGASQDASVVLGATNLLFQYRPRKGFCSEQCVHLDGKAYVAEALEQPDVQTVLEDLHQNLREIESKVTGSIETRNRFPRLVFLGTGSSVPSKGRNVSGLLVHLSEDSTVMLDCGEGTSGQLYRHFGSQTDDILRSLKAVFVSHLHADHHMGLFSLLRDRKAALELSGGEVTPALLLAPVQITRWLHFYHEQVEPVKHLFRLIPHQKLMPHMLQLPESLQMHSEVLEQISLSHYEPVEVDHCPNSFGVSMVHKDGWKLVFSGDTMPCERLVTSGEGCDVLVHEATHEDDLLEESKMKKHSTTSQAVDIGQRMGAKFILLNHFSQRYAKIPVFTNTVPTNVGIAFDNMNVSLQELPLLPHFIPALKALFAEEHADLEAKARKRLRKKEIQAQKQAQAIRS